jgi:nucleoporin p58/p45
MLIVGSGQNQPQQQASGMFSTLNQSQQQRPPGFGILGGGLGQSQNQQQQQTVPGVRISTENIRGTTRFNDLHDELQREIEFMDSVIQRQVGFKRQCDAIFETHDNSLSNIPNDVEFCRRKLMGLEAARTSDAIAVEKLQKLTAADIEHGQLSGRAIDNLRLPIQYHVSGVWPPKSTPPDNRAKSTEGEAQSFVGYFTSATDELSDTLAKNQKNLAEIEQHLRSVEVASGQQVASLVARKNGGSGADDDAVKELASALVEFEQSILNVAGKVGATREGVQSLQLNAFNGGVSGKSVNGKRTGIY